MKTCFKESMFLIHISNWTILFQPNVFTVKKAVVKIQLHYQFGLLETKSIIFVLGSFNALFNSIVLCFIILRR